MTQGGIAMTKTTKTPAGTGASKSCDCSNCVCKNRTNTSENQHLPLPGTCLTAYLKRYRNDLLALPTDRHIEHLVNCCNVILDAAERGWRQ